MPMGDGDHVPQGRGAHAVCERRPTGRDSGVAPPEPRQDTAAAKPPWDVLDRLDWYSFACAGCGERIYVGRASDQTVLEFAQLCYWLYGEPPVCRICQERARV